MKKDVVIVGSGLAGMYAALSLDPSLSCLLINKNGGEESNSMYAQGGVAAVTLPEDNADKHLFDTMEAGAGLCNEKAVRVLVEEGPKDILRLMELGVPFDRDEKGNLSVTREGAHGLNRILHCGGDATGLHMTNTLQERVRERANIQQLDEYALIDILTDKEGAVSGVVLQSLQLDYLRVDAPNVIIATGGIGRVYRSSTNATALTGDGIAAAFRAGAELENMEFVQFHPTALVHPGQGGRYFLISEALRGEGAVLRNRRWEPFMRNAHPMADLAPRDVVSRAIIREMRKYDLPNVYLDITARPREFLEKRFPTIYTECMRRDIDIAVNWIPVVPVQHYFMGGIKTGLNGETNLPGLYACGEASCTGVHGANRLASNSLLECLVFGRRCAQDINGRSAAWKKAALPAMKAKPPVDFDIHTMRSQIRINMTKKCGILRNRTDMTEAQAQIGGYLEQLENSCLATPREAETLAMATVADQVLKAALAREDSVGAHYRSDHEMI